MEELKEAWQIDSDFKEKAFLLQFLGTEYDVKKKLGLDSAFYYGCPVEDIEQTGLFGILDALIDLGLTSDEIMDFYIHGHVEPYKDSYSFMKGIIEIVNGLPAEEIKKKYGRFFDDERIAKFININNNTRMLMSFCYDKDDTYVFIPNKDDLYSRFSKKYRNLCGDYDGYLDEKEFQKIDGKLFRVFHFLVCKGYDCSDLQCLFDEQISDIKFIRKNDNKILVLNKNYACKISDDLLSLICFLKSYNYEISDPENLFLSGNDLITIVSPSGQQISFNLVNLEPNVYKYGILLENIRYQGFEISDVVSLCNQGVKNIELKCTDKTGIEHILIVKKELLLSISSELLNNVKRSYDLGFNFLESYNLFDMEQEFITIVDPNGKERTVTRKKLAQCIDIIILLQGEGYSFKDYDTLFDESKLYIVCYIDKEQEVIISKKQINKIIKVQDLANKEDLTESEKDLLFMINNYSIRRKLFEWLPYTAKKWIPSSAVISKIPAFKSHEYFYNNNYQRLGELKDKYHLGSYEEMEGLVSLGYILGLFDGKKSTSEKALQYIFEYFLKKGVSADEIHTTYGAINLSKGFNKDFADFFMKHYAVDSESFIEPDLGTNMVGELFLRFDEVLDKRPEKRIKTHTINKLLTPLDAMAAITNIQIDKEILGANREDKRFIRLVELLMKFGASKGELKWAISLYEQALLIDERDVSIPNINDLDSNFMRFISHLKSDPQAFISGKKTNCCSRYGGFAQDRLTHTITDPNWRYVTFTSPNRTFFDGLVWYDSEDGTVCIDNVEGQFSKIDKNNVSSVAMMAECIIRYADGVYEKMNELGLPCQKVNVGNDDGTASYEIFKYARQQQLIRDDNNPCNYPIRNGISTDAEKQFTITDSEILKLRRKL